MLYIIDVLSPTSIMADKVVLVMVPFYVVQVLVEYVLLRWTSVVQVVVNHVVNQVACGKSQSN